MNDRGPSESMYEERILDHYRHPRNRGVLPDADVDHEEENPLCGDVIRITLRLVDGRVAQAGFDGQGCAISQAAASMLTERIQGMTLEDVLRFGRDEAAGLLGVPISPVRYKCAVLAWVVLQDGLEKAIKEGRVKGPPTLSGIPTSPPPQGNPQT